MPMPELVRVISAHCDYSARMRRRFHWYRMVYDNGTWNYFGDRLSAVTIRASDRHQTTFGHVPVGAFVCEHDRGGPVNLVYIVEPDGLRNLEFKKYAGKLYVQLPGQEEPVVLPNPRH